jgi:hydrogenase maturation factor HypF (carbamoyltransferase family)
VDLENVHQWLLAKKLTLNKDKTEYMIIGSRQRISNLVILRVHKSKTLGVIIDEHLLWNHQIQNKCHKSFKRNWNDATN